MLLMLALWEAWLKEWIAPPPTPKCEHIFAGWYDEQRDVVRFVCVKCHKSYVLPEEPSTEPQPFRNPNATG